MQWTAERRRAVLVHELAHIRRADCRVQRVTQLACAIYWFNPLIWIAARHLRSERERACDDEVLRARRQTLDLRVASARNRSRGAAGASGRPQRWPWHALRSSRVDLLAVLRLKPARGFLRAAAAGR